MHPEHSPLGYWPLNLSSDANATILVAGEEAAKLGCDCVGTEHLLLALLAKGGALERIFLDLQVTAAVVREKITQVVKSDRPAYHTGPLTPHLGEVLHCSVEEARLMGCGLEADNVHLLLGITRQPTCAAAVILDLMTISPKEVREAVFSNLEALDMLPEKILERHQEL